MQEKSVVGCNREQCDRTERSDDSGAEDVSRNVCGGAVAVKCSEMG